MYRHMLRASSTSLRAATRTSASTRLSIAKIAARSYSSGNSQESGKKSNPFTQTLVYAAPTVLAVAGFWAFVDRPHQKAKLAKKLEHAEVTESKEPEIPEETVVSEEVPETVEVTEIIIAEEVAPTLSEETKEAIDLLTADLDQALEEGAIPEDAPITSETETTTEASSTEENSEAKPEGAFNPDTGEINWDCPCLGGMANGPCGEEFKAAFSCFVYSEGEPKGIDCIEKFSGMQECFRRHPDVYAEEIRDAEPFPEENQPEGAQVDSVVVTEVIESDPSVTSEDIQPDSPVSTIASEVVEVSEPSKEA